MSLEKLLNRYARPVPRYTSYPTAVQFSDVIDSERYEGWLRRLGPKHSLSIYIHVPFCRALCWFCGCNTTVFRDRRITDAYADLLIRELDLITTAVTDPGPVRHIHWGGGTPTAIGDAALRRVMTHLRSRLPVAADAECAIEIDPRTLTSETADVLSSLGFNRASLGVQDLDPAVQAAVNRIQSFETTAGAAARLLSNGIKRISADLMVGLPKQTEVGIRTLVEMVATRLRPDRVSVFAYAHVPWLKRHQLLIDQTLLPGPAMRYALAKTAAESLEAKGYVPIGLDHFALADDTLAKAAHVGSLRRNFQGYTDDAADALIGLGASAIGTLPQGYARNAPKVVDYRRAIVNGRFAVTSGIALNRDDRMRGEVIERLMCNFEVDLERVARRHAMAPSWFDADLASLQPLVDDGVVMRSGRRIAVAGPSRLFVRSVCAVFDRYVQEHGRHAMGV